MKTFEKDLNDLIRGYEWDFNDHGEQSLREMKLEVWRWVRQTIKAGMMPGETPYWLTIFGPSETGKTHLAQRAISAVIDITKGGKLRLPRRGFLEGQLIPLEAAFMSAPKIVEKEKNIYGFAFGWNQHFAIGIDDIGARGADTEFAQNTIYKILEDRAESGTIPPKAAIITSNMDWDVFGQTQDPRLASRLRRGKNIVHELPKETTAHYDR